MRRVGEGEDVGELASRFEDGAEIFRPLLLRHELLLADQHDIDEAADRREQERQLVGAVGRGGGVVAALVKRREHPGVERLRGKTVEHERVGKRTGRVEQAVGHRQADGQPRFGVLVVGGRLTGLTELVVLAGFDHAEADDADAHQRDCTDDGDAHAALDALVERAGEEAEHRDERARGIADRRRDGKLDIPEADIAERHRDDVEQGDGEVCPDDVPRDGRALHEDLKRGVQTHDHADSDDHFEVGVFVVVAAADLRKQIGTAPAEECDDCEPEPHNNFFSCNDVCMEYGMFL